MPPFFSNVEKIRKGKEFQSARDVKGYTSLPLEAGMGCTDNKEGLQSYLDSHLPLETLFFSHKPKE